MLSTTFPALQATTIDSINTLGEWLSHNEFDAPPAVTDGELIILAGNAVIPTIDAACELAANSGLPLLITGGIGHSTTFLYAAIAKHPRYNTIPTTGRAEAAIIKDIATQFWKIPAEKVLTEEKSTNCGENARFTYDLMQTLKITPASAIVIQDPSMQRRTVATFERAWQNDAHQPQWRSWPGFVPLLVSDETQTVFRPHQKGLWPVERYISLALGEIPRIRDDAQGYGPNGRDFITHVDIPLAVINAWEVLASDAALAQWMHERGLSI
ncbi:YdcF family protein [Buttiauxella ferragutiae ATCC 51602]|uniref:YdcF family protein n=1 Tax=Buttiauxella ferragutiae ATCC 51602 TaxID=1354252 RepID=A0ABX2W4T3_9ENTR|nr:YdcF family protein [Buttiauxella ferragutiae]OAT25750.1 YdcF family protein [Buttiauxella ferragutiae ATCC 51602]